MPAKSSAAHFVRGRVVARNSVRPARRRVTPERRHLALRRLREHRFFPVAAPLSVRQRWEALSPPVSTSAREWRSALACRLDRLAEAASRCPHREASLLHPVLRSGLALELATRSVSVHRLAQRHAAAACSAGLRCRNPMASSLHLGGAGACRFRRRPAVRRKACLEVAAVGSALRSGLAAAWCQPVVAVARCAQAAARSAEAVSGPGVPPSVEGVEAVAVWPVAQAVPLSAEAAVGA